MFIVGPSPLKPDYVYSGAVATILVLVLDALEGVLVLEGYSDLG